MDTGFYLVSAIVALLLFAIIARNLWRLDRRERGPILMAPPPPDEPPAPSIPPVDPDVKRAIPPHLLEELRDSSPPPPAEPVRFTAYYPKEVAPKAWEPMVAYVYRPRATDSVAADATRRLGAKVEEYRNAGDDARQPIAEGATITATPRLEGFQVNPPSLSVGFYEDMHPFEFKLRADTAPLDQAVNGMVTFTVEGVIVADIPLSIFVGERVTTAPTASAPTKPYDAVFCSYSRKDLPVVERVERAYKILGLDYLRDMMSIRSGEQWSDALEQLIGRADIFQLFWSSASSASNHVEMEWRHALSLAGKPANFIRPVYWEQPMPPVPDPLSHIHFAYEPTLDD